MASVPPPRLASNPKEQDWRFFHRQILNYFVIVEALEEAKLPLLLNSLSHDGIDIFDGLPAPIETFEDAIRRLTEYFEGKSSVLLRRKDFFQSRQAVNESISEFACKLRRLGRECDFGDTFQQMLRDIFVIGVRDDRLGERLLSEDANTLTFEEALRRAEAFERARTERRNVGQASQASTTVHATSSMKSTRQQSRNGAHSDSTKCFRCGSINHRANAASCPARSVECRHCHKLGHFQSVCKSRLNSQPSDLRRRPDPAQG